MARKPFLIARQQIDVYVDDCFANRTQPRVSDLANRLSISRLVLSRTFKREEGIDLSEYLAVRRHAEALILLRDSELDTTVISARSGHGSLRTLYRCFAQREGRAPERIREGFRGESRVKAGDRGGKYPQ